jgi:hypothetical protein
MCLVTIVDFPLKGKFDPKITTHFFQESDFFFSTTATGEPKPCFYEKTRFRASTNLHGSKKLTRNAGV